MSGSDDFEASGPDMLAAEYVLGVLDLAEAEAAEARIAAVPEFAADVGFWENALMPLAALASPLPPPAGLWPRIEATVGLAGAPAASSPRAANDNRLLLWRTTALAGFALAASLAAFIALRSPVAPVVAVLAPSGTSAPMLVAMAAANGAIYVRPTGALKVAQDRDLELWSLPPGATRPVSLGVLPAGGKQVPTAIAPGTKLLVSLEPKGGSPTGQPTGTVVYGGTLQRID